MCGLNASLLLIVKGQSGLNETRSKGLDRQHDLGRK